MNNMNLVKCIYQLDIVERWGGLYVTQRESVAQHSYHVACISGVLAIIEISIFDKNVDIQKVLLSALLHDITDSKLTHLTYDVKNINEQMYNAINGTKKDIRKALTESEINERREDLCLKSVLISDSNLNYLIESADVIDAMMFAKRETERNNKTFIDIYDRQQKQFQLLKQKYECVDYFDKMFLHK